jgi:Small-conductance mechanosensitive channel
MEEIEKVFGVIEYINRFLINIGVSDKVAIWLDQIIGVTLLFLLAYILDTVLRFIIHKIIGRIARYTKTKWDDKFLEYRVFRYLVHIVPGMLFLVSIPVAVSSPIWITILERVTQVFIVVCILRAIQASMKALSEITALSETYVNKPIKVVFQIIIVIAFFVGAIAIIGIIVNKSFTSLFVGLGASMTILMLIFKDSILGFVASWQLSSNDLVRIGDWITMPKYGADGDVEEINLYSVKVRNFDKTITTIPPYSLISESFQNWRGMKESGGRRVKRSVSIDMHTIKFCTPQMLERFRKIQYLTEYIEQTQERIKEYNEKNNIDNSVLVNGRRQTNIGVFRAYLESYLSNHPDINHNMTCMVRQLQPNEKGVQIELYFFVGNTDWIFYENVQSDVFDHIMAIIPQFELKIYQFPTHNIELPLD